MSTTTRAAARPVAPLVITIEADVEPAQRSDFRRLWGILLAPVAERECGDERAELSPQDGRERAGG